MEKDLITEINNASSSPSELEVKSLETFIYRDKRSSVDEFRSQKWKDEYPHHPVLSPVNETSRFLIVLQGPPPTELGLKQPFGPQVPSIKRLAKALSITPEELPKKYGLMDAIPFLWWEEVSGDPIERSFWEPAIFLTRQRLEDIKPDRVVFCGHIAHLVGYFALNDEAYQKLLEQKETFLNNIWKETDRNTFYALKLIDQKLGTHKIGDKLEFEHAFDDGRKMKVKFLGHPSPTNHKFPGEAAPELKAFLQDIHEDHEKDLNPEQKPVFKPSEKKEDKTVRNNPQPVDE